MINFMGMSLFIIGLLSVVLGLAIIIKDRLVSGAIQTLTAAPKSKEWLELLTAFINALASFAEKLFGQFVSKEKLPVFLIVIGIVICGLGWWMVK